MDCCKKLDNVESASVLPSYKTKISVKLRAMLSLLRYLLATVQLRRWCTENSPVLPQNYIFFCDQTE